VVGWKARDFRSQNRDIDDVYQTGWRDAEGLEEDMRIAFDS
jgi:hypothetical protein